MKSKKSLIPIVAGLGLLGLGNSGCKLEIDTSKIPAPKFEWPSGTRGSNYRNDCIETRPDPEWGMVEVNICNDDYRPRDNYARNVPYSRGNNRRGVGGDYTSFNIGNVFQYGRNRRDNPNIRGKTRAELIARAMDERDVKKYTDPYGYVVEKDTNAESRRIRAKGIAKERELRGLERARRNRTRR